MKLLYPGCGINGSKAIFGVSIGIRSRAWRGKLQTFDYYVTLQRLLSGKQETMMVDMKTKSKEEGSWALPNRFSETAFMFMPQAQLTAK